MNPIGLCVIIVIVTFIIITRTTITMIPEIVECLLEVDATVLLQNHSSFVYTT